MKNQLIILVFLLFFCASLCYAADEGSAASIDKPKSDEVMVLVFNTELTNWQSLGFKYRVNQNITEI